MERMMMTRTTHKLISQEKDGLQAKLSVTEVEEIFQRRSTE
jgi:hypothetical protein